MGYGFMVRVAVIGTGNLGSMLIRRFLEGQAVEPKDMLIINRSRQKAEDLKREYPDIQIYDDYQKIINDAELIFICVKPFDLPRVLEKTGVQFAGNKLIISTLLAPSLIHLEEIIEGKLVRIYPSVAQSTGRGVTILTWGKNIEQEDKDRLLPYLKVLGIIEELPENLYRAAGDVTSCGPAFMAAMIGALADEAVKQGISSDTAYNMALETMLGTALLMEQRNLSFKELITQVSTPGGCTAEGIKILNEELPRIISRVYDVTCRKDHEIQEKLKQGVF